MGTPALSIIIPVYNAREYLRDTVGSVLAQTFSDFELILVDDGAKDGSGELCDELAQKDPRVRVIHKENGGVAAARNTGLDAAAGDYIGWVDSDDWISPVMYELLMEQARTYSADIVQCEHSRWLDHIQKERPEQMPPIEVLDGLGSLKRIYRDRTRYSNALALWSKVYRRALFDGLRFTEGAAFEDDECVPKLLYRGRVNVFFDLPLYQYIRRENSIVTAPSVKNILALTAHLENRMLWFQTLDPELYDHALKNFYQYLHQKVCEKLFIGTPVQAKAVELLKKHRKRFWPWINRYDKLTILMLYCGNGAVQWVARNDYAPIQNILAKIKDLLHME